MASEGRDPFLQLDERAHDPDEPDFDWDVEIAALEALGYVLPLPIVERALGVARVVNALGWDAATKLAHGTWRGWEAEFLRAALVLIAEAERDSRILDQASMWRALFSPRGAVE